MICYTRNFEDVILQRVFSDLPNGRYLDVGASEPIHDSLTYALYQKGWRGVAIEPLPFQTLWQKHRPEDVLLSAAAGAAPGYLDLYVYDRDLQITHGSAEIAARWTRNNVHASRVVRTPTVTLDQVIDKFLTGAPIHLLTIDVEGTEREVLKGLNLAIHRPWLIVVEAVLPGEPSPNHHAWEPDLLSANYLMSYFDGVNRFYLAHEQLNLLGRFSAPPNVWDRFVTARQLELEARIKQLETQVSALQSEGPKRMGWSQEIRLDP